MKRSLNGGLFKHILSNTIKVISNHGDDQLGHVKEDDIQRDSACQKWKKSASATWTSRVHWQRHFQTDLNVQEPLILANRKLSPGFHMASTLYRNTVPLTQALQAQGLGLRFGTQRSNVWLTCNSFSFFYVLSHSFALYMHTVGGCEAEGRADG